MIKHLINWSKTIHLIKPKSDLAEFRVFFITLNIQKFHNMNLFAYFDFV